jgi:hypothetical protein
MTEEKKTQTISYDREEAGRRYHAALFTQLVLHGLSIESAKNRTNEAVDYINKLNIPFPEILVG